MGGGAAPERRSLEFSLNGDSYLSTVDPCSTELNCGHARRDIAWDAEVDLEAVHSVWVTSGVEDIRGPPVHQDVNGGTGQLRWAGSKHLAWVHTRARGAEAGCEES